MRPDETRRYRILGVVGQGGFGKVYHARLEGAEGFAKDVAIKLLTDLDAPEQVLQRFRDESRILGLVRDRAVVSVDPPTRLDGRWAVVMEFVDGADCHRLMRREPFPPRTALEIVQEVARALDHVYNQAGPAGEPLHLVHRDIKPGNIQITPAGTVKVLDFGMARATFSARESSTTNHIGGTVGYIAPERLDGDDGPASDIYSLGVVLAALVVGRRVHSRNRDKALMVVQRDPDLAAVWELAEQMQAAEPGDRPTAREVEDRCATLAPTLRGPTLRRWAEAHLRDPLELVAGGDALVGAVLTETMANLPRVSHADLEMLTATHRRSLFGVIAAFLGVGGMTLGGIGIAGTVALVAYTLSASPAAETPTPEAVRPAAAPAADLAQTGADGSEGGAGAPMVAGAAVTGAGDAPPTATDDDGAPVASPAGSVDDGGPRDGPLSPPPAGPPTEAAPEASFVPAPAPTPAPTPRPAPAAEPTPAPRTAPAPAAEPVPTFPVSIGSDPLGARIEVDGRDLGQRPLIGHELPRGRHTLRLSFADGRSATKQIVVGPDEPVRYVWRGGDTWSVFY